MKTTDVCRLAVQNLWRRRARTALNLIGVVIGCCVIIMTSAGVRGVRDAFHILFDSSEFARKITVHNGAYGPVGEPPAEAIEVSDEVPEGRRERIREALADHWREQQYATQRTEITMDDVREIEAIPHVASVVPSVTILGEIQLMGESPESGRAHTALAGTEIGLNVQRGMVVGKPIRELREDEVLIDEFLAYRLGYHSDEELEALIGRRVRFRFSVAGNHYADLYSLVTGNWRTDDDEAVEQRSAFVEAIRRLVGDVDLTSLTDEQKQLIQELFQDQLGERVVSEPATVERTFTIRAIVHDEWDTGISSIFRNYFGADGEMWVHHAVASKMQVEDQKSDEFFSVEVTVDSTRHLADVSKAIESGDYHPSSSLPILEGIEWQIDRSAWIVYVVAATILLTSAIGISNTLIISVLERTPEFGIMKSLGARDSQVLWMMICEGVCLGILGAAIAIVTSVVVSAVGQTFLQMYVERQVGGDMEGKFFQLSWQTPLIVVGLSTLICTVASLVPAWRAARLDPVVAMRRT